MLPCVHSYVSTPVFEERPYSMTYPRTAQWSLLLVSTPQARRVMAHERPSRRRLKLQASSIDPCAQQALGVPTLLEIPTGLPFPVGVGFPRSGRQVAGRQEERGVCRLSQPFGRVARLACRSIALILPSPRRALSLRSARLAARPSPPLSSMKFTASHGDFHDGAVNSRSKTS